MENTPNLQQKIDKYIPYLNPLAFLLTIALVAVLFSIVLKFAVNIPNSDEYAICLIFLEKWQNIQGFSEGWQLIFTQVNEHRVILYQLLLVLEQRIFGDVNFIRMMLVGNLGLVFIWAILWKNFDCKQHKFWYFLPITFLLFAPAWSRALWGCSSFFNTYVILFAFVALYFLQKKGTKNFVLATLFSVLSVISFGNGILVFPIGGLLLWVNNRSSKTLIAWSIVSVIILVWFFIGYQIPNKVPTSLLFTNPFLFLVYIFIFVGATFKYFSSVITPLLGLGIITTYAVLLWTQRNHLKKSSVLWSFAFFVMASIGLAAVARSGVGLQQGLSSRYELMPTLLLGILYLLAFDYYPRVIKNAFPYIFIFSCLLYVSRIAYNFWEAKDLKERLETGLIMHYGGDSSFLYNAYRPSKKYRKLLNNAEKTGFYKGDKSHLWQVPSSQKMDYTTFDTSQDLMLQVEVELDNESCYFAKGWGIAKYRKTGSHPIWLTLKAPNSNEVWAYKTTAIKRPNLSDQYGLGVNVDQSGFKILLPKKESKLPKGDFEMGFLLQKGKKYFYKKMKNISVD